jgi:23S rRNA pseudouridine1911/1915/1917 synthase
LEQRKLEIHFTEVEAGLRLDKALGSHPDVGSRSRAEQLIEQDFVTLAGKPLKSSYKIKAGDTILVLLPAPIPTDLVPLDRPIEVLFEDSDLIVLLKPAGLVVHPAAGHAQDTLVNMLIHHTDDLSMGFQENRPGIVHRLDRDTSGILVVAKNDFTHQSLSEKFQKRDLHRLYHAIALGTPPKPSGTISSYIGRHATDRKRFSSKISDQRQIIRTPDSPQEGARWAVTHYKILDALPSGLSYLQLKLETGRTHQIRVHLSEMGCPIAHDDLYGAGKRLHTIKNQMQRQVLGRFPRFALHARELGFSHPRTQEWLFFKSNWPDDLLPLIQELGFSKLRSVLEL